MYRLIAVNNCQIKLVKKDKIVLEDDNIDKLFKISIEYLSLK